jgi:formylglycine-generating enzyme required for sulfatase activity
MGSPTNEVDRESDESPQTQVTISHGFSMSKHEITQGQYKQLMGTNSSRYRWAANMPVEQVSWSNAVVFCARLTDSEQQAGRLPAGFEYRLPTEAEWEYVARAGTTNRFSYGDDPGYTQLADYAWYFVAPTYGVGIKTPNPWGLCDMYGNVAEWCLDSYVPYPGGQITDPRVTNSSGWKVVRGGSIEDEAKYCRSAFRSFYWKDDASRGIGFRVVMAPVVQAKSEFRKP